MARACSPTAVRESSRRIRATSSRSALSASRSRLESSTTANGSTKSVWPEPAVVHDSRHRATRRGAEREHRPPAALGDEVLRGARAERGHARARGAAPRSGRVPPALAAETAERGRRPVAQVASVVLDRRAIRSETRQAWDRCLRQLLEAGDVRDGLDRAPRRDRRVDRAAIARSVAVSSVPPRAATSAASRTSWTSASSGSADSSSKPERPRSSALVGRATSGGFDRRLERESSAPFPGSLAAAAARRSRIAGSSSNSRARVGPGPSVGRCRRRAWGRSARDELGQEPDLDALFLRLELDDITDRHDPEDRALLAEHRQVPDPPFCHHGHALVDRHLWARRTRARAS